MGCNCAQYNLANIHRVCRVCELVDKDYTTKEVFYCEFCDAYICKSCNTNILKRAKAALIDIRLKL